MKVKRDIMRYYRYRCNFVSAAYFWLLFVVAVGSAVGRDSQEFQKNTPAKLVWAVPGKDIELPCDVTPPLPSDNVKMIFWFKDNIGIPLYSLDARGGPLAEASHLAMSDDLGSRSYFITDDQPSKARLRIQHVNMHDEGVFRCRVDFNNSPTRNFQVNLTLVVQPSAPRLFDAEGREIRAGTSAGPFLENDELFLSCQVTEGRPHPTLTWWYNGTILDAVVDSKQDSYTTVNQLVIARTPRSYKGGRLECRASSHILAGDIIREVPIIVYLKPSKVKIVTPNDLLSVHNAQNMRCESSGSYPPAKITWLLDGKPIRSAVVTEEETDSFTGSIMSLNVVAEDDGKDLVCRADNPRFPGGSAEDRRQIHVAYPPKVAVTMDPGAISPVKEGADVTLRCEASARPSPSSYSWYHDGHLVAHNETGGILPSDDTLTIRGIARKSEGQYACSAINAEGETYSAPFDLIVQYAPHCRKGYEVMRVGSIPYETLVVQCHVDSVPNVTRFSWTYNTSKGVLPVQGAKMQNKDGVSTLHFTPGTDDLESLSCWAANKVGRQKKPCVFYILPAETPESPRNCIFRNTSHGDVEVLCLAGKDGGLHQSFVLEVSDVSVPARPPGATTLSDQGERSSSPMYRVMGERPLFRLHSLQPGREYQVLVYAENARGRSEPPVLLPHVRVETPMDATLDQQEDDKTTKLNDEREGSPAASSSRPNLTVILVALTAAAVLLIVGIVTAATIITCRRSRRRPLSTTDVPLYLPRRRNNKGTDDMELRSEAGFGEGFQRRSAQYRASMYMQDDNTSTEERISRLIEGPDLILAPVAFSPQSSEY